MKKVPDPAGQKSTDPHPWIKGSFNAYCKLKCPVSRSTYCQCLPCSVVKRGSPGFVPWEQGVAFGAQLRQHLQISWSTITASRFANLKNAAHSVHGFNLSVSVHIRISWPCYLKSGFILFTLKKSGLDLLN